MEEPANIHRYVVTNGYWGDADGILEIHGEVAPLGDLDGFAVAYVSNVMDNGGNSRINEAWLSFHAAAGFFAMSLKVGSEPAPPGLPVIHFGGSEDIAAMRMVRLPGGNWLDLTEEGIVSAAHRYPDDDETWHSERSGIVPMMLAAIEQGLGDEAAAQLACASLLLGKGRKSPLRECLDEYYLLADLRRLGILQTGLTTDEIKGPNFAEALALADPRSLEEAKGYIAAARGDGKLLLETISAFGDDYLLLFFGLDRATGHQRLRTAEKLDALKPFLRPYSKAVKAAGGQKTSEFAAALRKRNYPGE